MATKHADRGKYAEKEVNKYLKKLDGQLVHWDFCRVSDARSAGGRGAKTVVGDFEVYAPGQHFVLEVKQIAHDYRLPAQNVTQLPKLRKRTLAGGTCFVVVYHSTIAKWRRIPAMEMELRERGSWDLRDFPAYDSLDEALPAHLLGAGNE